MSLIPGTLLGRYEILSLIGAGGMGEVYRAHDRRLRRLVVVKVLLESVTSDAEARRRFETEAKAVAALSHPNILSIHDFANEGEIWFAVTELLEGATLGARIAQEPLPWREAVKYAIEIADGLSAAHSRGITHRDLKPENIFLTSDGRVKILDFGLAKIHSVVAASTTTQVQTSVGTITGTPGYMAPEQCTGDPTSAATDVFAFGCVLYEMLTGRRAFGGATLAECIAAVLSDQTPQLPRRLGVPGELERLMTRCLAKRPSERFASAGELTPALRKLLHRADEGAVSDRRLTRLIVLPFRMLRPSADVEYLAYSLPEAITSSLSNLGSLLVRSMATASRYADGVPDIGRIASECDVNAVLTGSLLVAGDQLRVSAQLADAPQGALLWSHSVQVPMGDVFQVQDELTRKIVESLEGPLTDGDSRALGRDVPRSALSYELFLRANQQGFSPDQWMIARDLYLRSLDEDPAFAPGWARLGRCHWLIDKYSDEPRDEQELAEGAFRRALELNPDLPLGHRLQAEFDVDRGRTIASLERLIRRVHVRPNDPELYGALVKTLRYAGLLDDSLRAHDEALHLDPRITTSVPHTYFMRGDYEKSLASNISDVGLREGAALVLLGRPDEAERLLHKRLTQIRDRRFRAWPEMLLAILAGDRQRAMECVELTIERNTDPEAAYYGARSLAYIGEAPRALELLRWITKGFFCVPMLESDRWLNPLRGSDEFQTILNEARERHRDAERLWRCSGMIAAN